MEKIGRASSLTFGRRNKMKGLRKFLRKFENAMSAATFAEAGEAETAREILQDKECRHEKTKKRKIEDSKPVILKPSYL